MKKTVIQYSSDKLSPKVLEEVRYEAYLCGCVKNHVYQNYAGPYQF